MRQEEIPIYQLPQKLKPDKTLKIVSKDKYIFAHRDQPAHRHLFYELLLVWIGEGQHFIDFNPYPIQNNTVTFIHPKQVHQGDNGNLLDFEVLIFNREFFENDKKIPLIDDPLFPTQNFTLQLSEEQTITVKKYLTLLKEEYSLEMVDPYILSNLLRILLRYFARIRSTQIPMANKTIDSRTLHFQRLVELNFHVQHLPSFYASDLNLSIKHLNTLVKKDLGYTATDLIKERIILEIKRLLRYSDLTHKEISFKIGFDDPAYMSRYFKKHTGISPRDFSL